MIIGGVDLSKLGDQFHGFVPGRTLIIDGDGPAYVASATRKTLPSAIKVFQQSVLTKMFLAQAERAIVHLTASTSYKAGRFNILAAKPYQGQRKGKAKPPLLEPVRQAMANKENWLPEFEVVMHHILEADDGMMQDSYRLKEHGVIDSDDKDLRMTPYPYYCQEKGKVVLPDGFGSLFLKISETNGTKKCLGYGKKFFWAQMLMGDSADNIKGILTYDGKLCGPGTAFDVLDPITDEHEAANLVIGAYREIDQNPIPEGWLLWLLRWDGDTFWRYCGELNFSAENKAFLADCVNRVWFKTPEAANEEHVEEDCPF